MTTDWDKLSTKCVNASSKNQQIYQKGGAHIDMYVCIWYIRMYLIMCSISVRLEEDWCPIIKKSLFLPMTPNYILINVNFETGNS